DAKKERVARGEHHRPPLPVAGIESLDPRGRRTLEDDLFSGEFREKSQVTLATREDLSAPQVTAGLRPQAVRSVLADAYDNERLGSHGWLPSRARDKRPLTAAAARALPPLRPSTVITGTGRRNASSLL